MEMPVQHKHGPEEAPLPLSWDTSPTLVPELNRSGISRNDTMPKTPKKDVAEPPVFLSRAEDSFESLPPKKKKSGRVIVERVAKHIEEELVETGKVGWMRRAREMGSRPGAFIILPTNVAKYDPWAKLTPYRGQGQEASASSAGGGSAATSRWPSVREARRRKHIPIPGPGPRPLPRQLCALWEEQKSTPGPSVPGPPAQSPPGPPPSKPLGTSGETEPKYNAFSATGYWASHGYRAAPTTEEMQRVGRVARSRCSSDSDSDSDSDTSTVVSCQRRREVIYGPTAPRKPMFRSHTTPGAFFTEATRPPPDTIPALESNRQSARTDITIEEKPFNPVDFLEQIGVFPGRPSDDCCPFPGFDNVPDDQDTREAYEQVRSTLVGFWYSHIRAKEEEHAKKEHKREEKKLSKQAGDRPLVKSMPSLPQLKSSPSRPELKSKPSMFKTLLNPGATKTEESLRMYGQDSDRHSESGGSDITVVHVGPELKPKKSSKDLQTLNTKSCKDLGQEASKGVDVQRRRRTSFVTAAREALAITQIVLRQLQTDFAPPRITTRPISDPDPKPKSKKKRKSGPSLDDYMLRLPQTIAENSAALHIDERACFKTYSIHTMDQLCFRGYWHIRLSPRDWIDPDFVDDPEEYKFETILDRQIRGLAMLKGRRNGVGGECRVTKAALRVIWATKFVEEMEKLCERAHSQNTDIPTAVETGKEVVVDEGVPPPPPDDSDAHTFTTSSNTYVHDEDDYDSDSDNEQRHYTAFVRAIQSQSQPHTPVQSHFQPTDFYERVVESVDSESSPPPPPPKDDDAESVRMTKLRRRKTTFNMGLLYGALSDEEA